MTNGGSDSWWGPEGSEGRDPSGAGDPTGETQQFDTGQFRAAGQSPPESGAGSGSVPTSPGYGAGASGSDAQVPRTTPQSYQYPYATGSFPASVDPVTSPQPVPTAAQTAPYGSAPGASGQPYGGQVPPQQPGGSGSGSDGRSGRRWPMIALAALLVALVAGGVGGAIGVMAGRDDDSPSTRSAALPTKTMTNQPEAAPGSVQDVAAQVLPSVVSITVAAGNEVGSGSGVVLSEDGTILTNNHVVSAGGSRPASEVLVSFNDGSRAKARVIGADSTSDIAVLKAEKTGLRPITVGTSKNVSVGQDVIAIGSPLGLDGTVTTGIISSLNRPVSTSGADGSVESVIDAIQTDAAINPGNSGGALVNSSGALIGINTAIATLGESSGSGGSIGLGFAIPIDQAMRVAQQLLDGGKVTMASLGVTVRENSDLTSPGALVNSVSRGGAAASAGIPAGALITSVDDRKIASSEALIAAIRSHAPNDQVTIGYSFRGADKTVSVKLGTA